MRTIFSTEYKPIAKDGETTWYKIENVLRDDKLSINETKSRYFKKLPTYQKVKELLWKEKCLKLIVKLRPV